MFLEIKADEIDWKLYERFKRRYAFSKNCIIKFNSEKITGCSLARTKVEVIKGNLSRQHSVYNEGESLRIEQMYFKDYLDKIDLETDFSSFKSLH